jgi:hypothetical protein
VHPKGVVWGDVLENERRGNSKVFEDRRPTKFPLWIPSSRIEKEATLLVFYNFWATTSLQCAHFNKIKMGEGFCFLQSVSNYGCVNFQLRLILQEVYNLNVCIFFNTIKKKHHKIYWKEFKKF